MAAKTARFAVTFRGYSAPCRAGPEGALIMWQRRLDEYLAAKRERDEATRLFWRALRAMERLAPRNGDARAVIISGVDLADEHSVRAAGKERLAARKLTSAPPSP